VTRFIVNKKKTILTLSSFVSSVTREQALSRQIFAFNTSSYRQFIRTTIGGIIHCYNTSPFSAGCTFSCVFVVFFSCQISSSETQGQLIGAGGNKTGKEMKHRMFTLEVRRKNKHAMLDLFAQFISSRPD